MRLNTGSNPATFDKLGIHMQKGLSLDDFITIILRDARKDLVAFPDMQILKALKDHSEGISPEFSNNLENKGVELLNSRAVGFKMRGGVQSNFDPMTLWK